MSDWDVGADIGGTFTDIVAIHTGGETRTAKVPSRPDAPVQALLEALAAISLELPDIRRFVHGTTRVTNAIVQDRLPPIALIATAGFSDVLAIGRLRRRELYRLDTPPKLPPLVPAGRTFGLVERLDHTGAVTTALTGAELDRMAAWVAASGVQSVAICLLHSYANPDHERRAAERLRGIVPHLSLSHRVNPEAREYERASATAFNAAAMPIAAEYLTELEHRIPLGPGLLVFHSAGGMMPTAAAKARPIAMAMSGPAAGVAASARVAAALDLARVLTFDMGGTTTDVCLIEHGAPAMAATPSASDRPLRQPMLAVHSIGAGGGSLVRLGPGGLTIGPHSAGAVPGPACYGQGGTEPTVTDANLVLGYLDPASRFGGRITPDPDLAARALEPIARAIGRSLAETALGVVQVANAAMARALRRVTVERGVDARACTLLAFGGGGPMHAAGLAEIDGIGRVVVPQASSAFSALGCLQADLSFLAQQTVRLPLATTAAETFAARLDALAAEAAAPLAGHAPAFEHTALMRYEAQSDATPVPFTVPLDPARLAADFQAAHHRLYGYSTAEPVIVESLRVQARVPSTIGQTVQAAGVAHPATIRRCTFPGAPNVETAILPRTALDRTVHGPAIIADAWSTTVIPPGWQAHPRAAGHLDLVRV